MKKMYYIDESTEPTSIVLCTEAEKAVYVGNAGWCGPYKTFAEAKRVFIANIRGNLEVYKEDLRSARKLKQKDVK